jgi:methylaspartate mutase sigma subunit
MHQPPEKSCTVLTGVIGEDVHIIGIRIVEHVLRQAGFNVVPLGAQVSQEEFLEAAIETNASAILVSSLSGHAAILCEGLREKCLEAGLDHVLLYLGGQLVIGDCDWSKVVEKFKALGFDRVYPPDLDLNDLIADLTKDCS